MGSISTSINHSQHFLLLFFRRFGHSSETRHNFRFRQKTIQLTSEDRTNLLPLTQIFKKNFTSKIDAAGR